nr:nickel-dependent lactate racemase [Candidatus Sigynarchaeota archaeon]
MKTRIAYGKTGLEINLPDSLNVTIGRPEPQKTLVSAQEGVTRAINSPIGSKTIEAIIKAKQKKAPGKSLSACIVVSDHTRPVPSHVILPPLLVKFEANGIRRENITILVGTGLHRGSTPDELARMLGKDIPTTYKVVNHDFKDASALKSLGTSTFGTPISINKTYTDADLKILTGYVDPHFFAGYAGGRKAIVPGISGEETVIENHSARNINDPNARFTVLKGNPIHEDALEIAKKVGVDFIVNVCLDEQHRIVNVAAGGLEAVHDALVQFMKQTVVKEFPSYFDIVVVNNGGYPLDMNLYQAVKSMVLGEMAVKEGGTIIAANEAIDGFGSDEFKAIIETEPDPDILIKKLLTKEMHVPAQWQVQTLARAAKRAEILVVSAMPRSAFEKVKLGLKHAESVEKAIEQALKKHGKKAKILILPAGPQLIPCITGSGSAACKVTPR